MPATESKFADKFTDLPSSLLFKMQSRWNKMRRYMEQMRKDSISKLCLNDFEDICSRAGVSWTDFEKTKVCNLFSNIAEGSVEIKPFLAGLQTLLLSTSYPAPYTVATSLALGPHFSSNRPEGKSIEISELRSSWNNLRRQMPDPSGSGDALVKTLIEGQFYEKKSEYIRPHWHRGQPGLFLDAAMNQPMVKSLMEGEYYLPKGNGTGDSRCKSSVVDAPQCSRP